MEQKLTQSTIVDLLKREGALTVEDLYKRTKKRHSSLTNDDLQKRLMRMEIQGLVKVYQMPRGKRRVELARR